MNRKLSALLLLVFAALTTMSASAKKNKNEIPQLTPGTHYEAIIQTSEGNITIMLYNETPIHRDNFIKLAASGFYDGILFHRVIENFVIQAGDPSSKEASQVATYGTSDAGYKLEAEILPNFYHRRGAVAAARDADPATNPTRESSGSQFYIVTGGVYNDSTIVEARDILKERGLVPMTPEREKIYMTEGGVPYLDGDYTIFGQMVSGDKALDKINEVPVYRNDRPRHDVYIKGIKIKVVSDKKRR